jgi:Mrp family chromosome partitioning ATPase/cell division septum initiation protein DivIVA
MTTIRGIAKARWWLLIAAAILAYVLSGELAEYRNANLPTFEAVTSVTFIEDPQALERDDFETFLEGEFARATDVNSGVLDETPGAFIPWLLAEIDLENDQNQLLFIGRGDTQESANELAFSMRENYLDKSTIGAGLTQAQQDLEELTGQINALRQEIQDLAAASPLSPEQLTQQTQRAVLEGQIAALRGHLGTLTTQLMNPELVLRTPESIQAEMDRTLEQLNALEIEFATYPLPPDPALAATQNEELLLKQLELSNLETRWNERYTTARTLESLANFSDVDPQPVTLDAASTSNNQMLAVVGALGATLIGLIAIERGRGMMWSAKDLEEGPPVIVELPSRPLAVVHHPSNQPWYLESAGGRRKAAIQMLRSQLDDHDNAVIALQGSGVFKEDIRELTADVATAVAVSGRSVLLIDASFEKGNRMVEWGLHAGPTLASLLHGQAGEREELISEFKTTLLSTPEVAHGLRAIRSGSGQRDAADELSGYRFELLMEVARELFDIVLISGSNLGEAASHVLAQRVDSVILVASAGHTVTRSLEAADRDFSIRRATLLGVVMIRRRRSRLVRSTSTGLRAWLWKTIDRFSEGRAAKAEAKVAVDDGEDAEAPGEREGAHVRADN